MRIISYLFAVVGVVLTLSILVMAFSTGPLPQHTGGFQESTCIICHTDYGLNEGRTLGGTFFITGVPENYNPGETYPLTITLSQPGQQRWGFQLSSRFFNSGQQAGELSPVDDLTQLKEAGGIQYIEHTEAGTRMGTRNGPVQFNFDWIAPPDASGPVLFNAAGNAANASADPTGDYIYTAGAFTAPEGEEPPELTRQETPQEQDPQRTVRINQESHFVHLPVPVNLERGNVEIHIEHRFLEALADSSPGRAFGIDSGANIRLGMNYALSDRLSAGISRARFDQILTLESTYELKSDLASRWRMSLVGGVEGQRNFESHYSPFLQLANSFDFKIFRFFAVPTLIFNSRREQDLEFRPNPINPQDNHTFSMGLGVDAALNRRLSLSWEFVPRVAGFGGFGEENPSYSAGVKIRTWGHVFSIFASSSRAFTPARYGVNTQNDLSLGFNIYRRIR